MTLRFLDNLKHYSTTTQLSASAIANGTFNSGAGPDGTNGFWESGGGGSSNGLLAMLSDSGPGAFAITQGQAIHLAGKVKCATNGYSGVVNMLYFYNAATSAYATLVMDQADSDKLKVYSFGNTLLAAESSASMTVGTWYRIEVRFIPDEPTGGVWQVWIDGVLVINFSGDSITTTYSTITRVNISGGNTYRFHWDDVIAWDESGSDFAEAGEFGDFFIDTLDPSADGYLIQMTPSTGSNYQNVDDPTFHDAGSTYNTATADGQQDFFALNDITVDATKGIRAIKFEARTELASAGSGTGKLFARLNSTDYTLHTFTQASSTNRRTTAFLEKNPVTGLPFTFSDVNDMQFGIERTSMSSNLRVTQLYALVLRGGAPYTPPSPSGAGGAVMFIPTI